MARSDMHAWAVEGSVPAETNTGHQFRRNLHYTVICDGSERAMQLVREIHPDVKIWVVRHLGDRNNVIVDEG